MHWDELQPTRASEWKEREDGSVSLLVPPYGRGRFGSKLQGWLRAPSHEVHLDEIGTFVWRRCDGATRVDSIAGAMRAHFGDRVEPVEGRLTLFLQQLVRGRFVTV
jgi:hypothetical protein